MKKKILILAAALIVGFVGKAICFPITVEDDLGREITIPEPPQRIVSLVPSHTEILFALGLDQKIVGVTKYCNYPLEAGNKDKVGGWATPDVEKIVALNPDLILTFGTVQQALVKELEEKGQTVFWLYPQTVEAVLDSFEKIGRITDRVYEAGQLRTEIEQKIEAVEQKTSNIPEKERLTVFRVMGLEPPATIGSQSFQTDVHRLAGGQNIFSDVDKDYFQLDLETLLERDPDVIIICGQDEEEARRRVMNQEGWQELTAVKNGRILVIPCDLVCRPSPQIGETIEKIAAGLYPELFLKGTKVVEAGTVELGEIVVTAGRRPQLLANVPVSTTTVTRKDIEAANALDVAEAIQQTAGVKVDSYGAMGAAATVTLRGSSAKQVLVLVDGMPLNTASLGIADLSMYPTDNIEKIEVVRGPFSALYGANALGGVVNIITQSVPEKQRVGLSASYGQDQTQVYQLSYGDKLSDMGYFLTLSHNRSEGHRENSDCQWYQFTGKLDYDFGNGSEFSLSTGHSEQEKGVPGSTSWSSPNARQDDKRSWADLTYKRSGGRSNLILKTYLNRDWGNYRNPDSWGGPTDDVNINSRLGLNLQQDINLKETNIFTWGIDVQNDRADIGAIGEEKKLNNYAVYVQDELNLLDSADDLLLIMPGLRYDHHDIYGNQINPRLSCLFQLSEQTDLRASCGRAFRAPTVNDLYWPSAGNPDLKPEKSFGYEIGIEHLFNFGLLSRATLFRSMAKELIQWAEDATGVWRPENVSKAEISGVEAEARMKLPGNISAGITYTYLEATDKETDKYLRYKPRHKAELSLGYENASGLKINISADHTDSVFSDKSNTEKLDRYTLLNARISQQLGQNVELFCSGKNLLDEEYQIYKDYPMPGLTVSGGIKAKF
ncbi:MAG: TonB-dependent receptor [bacterium]|nr:TonB-dependent receptor [bacterium]